MTNDPSRQAGTIGARWLLEQSETALQDVLAAFEVMANRLRGGEDVAHGDISKARIALAATRAALINEVNKHERQVLYSEGLIAEAPLDFDAMRAEIGRHLDRLRDAELAGDVSGGAVE